MISTVKVLFRCCFLVQLVSTSNANYVKFDISKTFLESYRHDYNFDQPDGKENIVSFINKPKCMRLRASVPIARQWLIDKDITDIKLYAGAYFLIHDTEPVFRVPNDKLEDAHANLKVKNMNQISLTRTLSPRDTGLLFCLELFNNFSAELQFSRVVKDKFNESIKKSSNFLYVVGSPGRYTKFVQSIASRFSYIINSRWSISVILQKDTFMRKQSNLIDMFNIEEDKGEILSIFLELNCSYNISLI